MDAFIFVLWALGVVFAVLAIIKLFEKRRPSGSPDSSSKAMPIVPGMRYVLQLGNPWQPDPEVVVLDVKNGWVKYRFTDSDMDQHSTMGHFRRAYHEHSQPLYAADRSEKCRD